MKTSSIKMIFLDIGGVLLRNGLGPRFPTKGCSHVWDDYTAMDTFHHFIFNIYEIDSITLNEYLDRVVFNKSKQFLGDEGIETIVSKR